MHKSIINSSKIMLITFSIILTLLYPHLCFSSEKKISNCKPISVTVDEKPIKNGDIVYIKTLPKMPKIEAKYNSEHNEKITWKLKVLFKRKNRNDIPSFQKTVNDDNTLNSNEFDEVYVGGITLIEASDNKGNKDFFTFQIRAKNPSNQEVHDYIGDTPWYSKAIARHESGQQNKQYYCQFNEIGTLGKNYINDIKYTPNRSSDKIGWGIYQITLPKPTHSELWNWQKNIDKGKVIINDKRKLAQSYFDAVKRTFPDKYEAPPTYTPKGCKTELSALDTASIQLFNGASVQEALSNNFGSNSIFISCWKFYPNKPPGQRWKFIPNRNEYVLRIISTYESMQE
ncbi:MAG TPA: hypothetical protein QF753_19580 [Victivallales bacterium]|nr:hypothetical protein [Victivallales bacterium]